MNPIKSLKARQERIINQRVEIASSNVASELHEMLLEREPDPYCLPIPRQPWGIDEQEYANRVQMAALQGLARVGLAESVTYNPEATRHARHTIETVMYESPEQEPREIITLIFDRTA